MSALTRSTQSNAAGRLEVALIAAAGVLAAVALLANPTRSTGLLADTGPGSGLAAQANAMPHQGWAPMTTHFSAFGSKSDNGTIVRYEWDLDGNGLYDTDATAAAGYTSHTYAKPGEYVVTLRVMDDQGSTATDSLTISVRHPASSPVDYWTVFDDSRVQRVDIELSQASWDELWIDPPAKTTVRANAVVFGERLNDVGFRMRGQFSLRESKDKKPWKIDTDFYVEGQEYRNLKQLMFINNIGDPTMLAEKIVYDMLAFAGVPASHSSYVELWIDISDDDAEPVFWGVYSMVERVDKKFLASRFGNDNDHGNLYKASHAQRGPMDLIYYGDEIQDYPTQNGQYAYGKVTNLEEPDYRDVINLARVVDGTTYSDREEFAAALEEVFEVDTFLRYVAVMNAISSWDYYPYTGNNFFLYSNPETGRIDWIPWDLTLGEDPGSALFELSGFGLVERAPLYDRVFEVEKYRWKYAAYLDLIVRHRLNESAIYEQASRLHNLIAPYVTQGTGDKMFFGDAALFPYESFATGWERLAEFARQRSSFIRQELAELDQTPTNAGGSQ